MKSTAHKEWYFFFFSGFAVRYPLSANRQPLAADHRLPITDY